MLLVTHCYALGESGLGKTTFINTLFATTIKNHKVHEKRHERQLDRTVEIEITKAGKYKVKTSNKTIHSL